jgi:hypothetical protein
VPPTCKYSWPPAARCCRLIVVVVVVVIVIVVVVVLKTRRQETKKESWCLLFVLGYKAFQQTIDNPMGDMQRQLQEALQALQQSNQALQQSLIDRDQLLEGTYFSSIEEVWSSEAVSYNDRHHRVDLRRSQTPTVDSYTTTFTQAHAVENNPRNETSNSRNSAPARRIWPVDIFGIESPAAQIAHLVPASAKNASLYDDVAAWTLALPANTLPDVLQKAIHGSVPVTGNRILNTGLKHSVCNKIRLGGQATFYDRHPCIMIVPVMTLDEVKDWNGGPYDALVMAGPDEDTRTEIGSVCTAMGRGMMRHSDRDIATHLEIEKARGMLKQVVCGLAHSLTRGGRSHAERELTALSGMRSRFLEVQASATTGVHVPVQIAEPLRGNLRVKKVTFLGQTTEEVGHPAPDPLLLTIKAAINWSRRHGQTLLAGGELPDDDEASELSVLAEEQYLEWQREILRPKNRQDLADGLGQPNGYQNVATAN